ncbi:helix-turn-helix domain-containing protein [Saccharopolyspora antimicrobica]|uniref:helix-turn-helix domain-containing protein n=1 Tax=Saccharopolyspora antimicrobica TaxID=455193 RepID=UPI001FE3D7B6|nr:helix-turn-helix transcriptional regulator [Saccharopolyspora antimicrobica]
MTTVVESDWQSLRDRRMAEPGASEAYEATRIAFELGRTTRELREQRSWTQAQLAEAAGMSQPAVARFEAGGTVPTIPLLERLARALGVELVVRFDSRSSAA